MIMRKPTKEEQIKAWEHLAWQINLHRMITMDEGGVISCLKRIDAWVGAHADANGERPEKEVDANVNAAFWNKIAMIEPGEEPPKRVYTKKS